MSAPTTPDPSPGRATGGGASTRVRLAALAVLVVTFAAGAALGWGASRWSRHRGGFRPGRPPIERRLPDRVLDQIDLTPAQRASIDTILERRRSQLDAFWTGPGRQLRLIVDSTRSEVRAVLTPAQRTVYDSIAERHRRRERSRPRGARQAGAAPGVEPRPPDERE